MTVERSTSPPEESGRAERARLRRVYEEYAADPYYRKIWSESPASVFMLDRKWELIRAILGAEGFDLGVARVLDLGAGGGDDCARFRRLGVRADGIVALDLLEPRARHARRSHPWMSSLVGDAAELPLRDASFDVVYQSTLLSSILEARQRDAIFGEVRRVLARGGLFLSYDVRYPNPRNPHTRPLKASELAGRFPGWTVKVRSVTALPPLLRFLAPRSMMACRVAESFPPLRSHLLAAVRKPC
jgi:SAM-dependent methyltransferase